jgi:hypothetical protein
MRALITVLLVAGLLVVGVAPASAHGNHVTADAQVSADSTVAIESLFLLEEGFVVLHADNGGEPGRVIGQRALDSGFQVDVPVEMNEDYWGQQNGTTTVWAVLHHDSNSDGTFDPGTDEQLSLLDRVVGTRFTVRKSETDNTSVTAAGFKAQTMGGPSVTVRRVALAQPGYVVVSANDDGSLGAVVGQQALDAGVHENVTVDINPSFYEAEGEQFRLWAGAHTSDSDGSFEASEDPPVLVNGTPVATILPVQKSGNDEGQSVVNTATNTPAPETTTGSAPSPDTTDPPRTTAGAETTTSAEATGTTTADAIAVETTGSGTATAVTTSVTTTIEETSTQTAEQGRRESGGSAATTGGVGTTGASGTSGPGFGITMMIAALVVATVLLGARSWRR